MRNEASSNSYAFRRRGPFKVIVCFITIWSFLFNTVSYDFAWAVKTPIEPTSLGSDRAGSSGIFKALNVDTFNLPEYLGHIKDAWSPGHQVTKSPEEQTTIIHIQDAHCNYFAQQKIVEILEYLNKEYGVNTINLEGGAKDYDLSIFTNIADKSVREKVADNFVREGLVSGAEYFAITNFDRISLWGVEDTKLYLENLNVYRESLKYKEEVDKELKSLNHILSNLKRHIYSKELFELDMRYTSYKEGNLEFKEYLKYLVVKAKDGSIDIKTYKNIFILNQSLEQEDRIDFRRANVERDNLIDRLQKKISKNALEELVLKTLEFKTGKISQLDFYNYVIKKAKSVNIELEEFPVLQKYIIYVSMYAAVDKPKIIDEINDLEAKIKESLCESDKQKTLVRLSKNLALLKNIFNISLTKDDYKYYLANESGFDMKNYAAFIKENAPLYKLSAELDKDIIKIDSCRDNITRFYECSLRRDEAFLKNIRFEVNGERSALVQPQTENRKPKTTIIVTGGFHTENLCELFKKSNISFVSIMPNFKNEDGYECPYFRLLAGELTGIQKRLYSVMTSVPGASIQIASMLTILGEDVWKRANIDATRAAVLIQQIEITEGLRLVEVNRDSVVFSGKNGERVTWSIGRLLNAVHQRDIDAQMEKLPENAFEDIENINSIIDEVKEFLRSIGASQEILNRVEALKGKNADGRALVRLVRGVTFRGHAGGQGIRVNANLKGNEQELKAVIVHEIIAGLFGNHFLAYNVEQAFLANRRDVALAKITPFQAPIWGISAEGRLALADRRDFEATEREALTRPVIAQFQDILGRNPTEAEINQVLEKSRQPGQSVVSAAMELAKSLKPYATGDIVWRLRVSGDKQETLVAPFRIVKINSKGELLCDFYSDNVGDWMRNVAGWLKPSEVFRTQEEARQSALKDKYYSAKKIRIVSLPSPLPALQVAPAVGPAAGATMLGLKVGDIIVSKSGARREVLSVNEASRTITVRLTRTGEEPREQVIRTDEIIASNIARIESAQPGEKATVPSSGKERPIVIGVIYKLISDKIKAIGNSMVNSTVASGITNSTMSYAELSKISDYTVEANRNGRKIEIPESIFLLLNYYAPSGKVTLFNRQYLIKEIDESGYVIFGEGAPNREKKIHILELLAGLMIQEQGGEGVARQPAPGGEIFVIMHKDKLYTYTYAYSEESGKWTLAKYINGDKVATNTHDEQEIGYITKEAENRGVAGLIVWLDSLLAGSGRSTTVSPATMRIDTAEARQAATAKIFGEEDASVKKLDPIAIVGLPISMKEETEKVGINLERLKREIGRGLWQNGYGTPNEPYKVDFFFMTEGDSARTKESLRPVLSQALRSGRPVVLFAPQNANIGLQLAADEELKGLGVTMVPDSYEDLKTFPDVVARMAIARWIVYCKEVDSRTYKNEDARRLAKIEAFKPLRAYLENITDMDLTGVDTLEDLLKKLNEIALRIMPIDYNKIIGDWERSQKATATSV